MPKIIKSTEYRLSTINILNMKRFRKCLIREIKGFSIGFIRLETKEFKNG